jgi:hypothetical protein
MKPPLTVTWHNYDSSTHLSGFNLSDLRDYETKEANWPAYIAQYPTEWHTHLEAIRQSIIDNEVWTGGDWHQYSPNGIPVLSDGHFMSCSWRDWGDLLSAVWNSELGQHFTYMDFYMDGRLPPWPGGGET